MTLDKEQLLEAAAQVEAGPERPTPPEKQRVLNVSVSLKEGADAAEIIRTVTELGDDLLSVSINQQYDYGW